MVHNADFLEEHIRTLRAAANDLLRYAFTTQRLIRQSLRSACAQ